MPILQVLSVLTYSYTLRSLALKLTYANSNTFAISSDCSNPAISTNSVWLVNFLKVSLSLRSFDWNVFALRSINYLFIGFHSLLLVTILSESTTSIEARVNENYMQ